MQILVLGMHRSGTSCVTRLLNMMGAYFGPEGSSMGANQENPRGFWERRDMRVVCDRLLHGAGAAWWRVANFATDQIPPRVVAEAVAEFREILSELDAHRPWVLKEPRLCLVLPVLRPQLEAPVCVQVYRNPAEIAHSLRTRNGFVLSFGLALWEFYTRSAINASSGLPKTLVLYGDLVADPVKAVRRLYQELIRLGVKSLHLPSDEEVRHFVDASLYRERADPERGKEYMTYAQCDLDAIFSDGRVLDLDGIPGPSAGAREVLLESEEREAAFQALQERQSQLESQVTQLKSQLTDTQGISK